MQSVNRRVGADQLEHERKLLAVALTGLLFFLGLPRLLVAGTVTYRDWGSYLAAIQDIPGIPVTIPFHGPGSVVQPSDTDYYGTLTVSNVTFSGHLVVFGASYGASFLINYDCGCTLTFHSDTGFRAFGGDFSSYSSPFQSHFTGTITTDKGESFTFPGLTVPNGSFFGFIPTNTVYDVTFSDGGGTPGSFWIHEEAVWDLYLVLVTPPKLQIFPTHPQVTLGITGPPGQTVALEVSTNLVTWQALATNTLTSDRWIYADTPPGPVATRFYRTSPR